MGGFAGATAAEVETAGTEASVVAPPARVAVEIVGAAAVLEETAGGPGGATAVPEESICAETGDDRTVAKKALMRKNLFTGTFSISNRLPVAGKSAGPFRGPLFLIYR